MSKTNIPPEALEAAYQAYIFTDTPKIKAALHVAIEAALNAWPGMRTSRLFPPNELHIVLPLTQETSE